MQVLKTYLTNQCDKGRTKTFYPISLRFSASQTSLEMKLTLSNQWQNELLADPLELFKGLERKRQADEGALGKADSSGISMRIGACIRLQQV